MTENVEWSYENVKDNALRSPNKAPENLLNDKSLENLSHKLEKLDFEFIKRLPSTGQPPFGSLFWHRFILLVFLI